MNAASNDSPKDKSHKHQPQITFRGVLKLHWAEAEFDETL